MKVLFGSHSVEHYNIGLLNALSKEVQLYTLSNRKLKIPSHQITIPNVRKSDLPRLFSLSLLSTFLNFDVIHANNSHQGSFVNSYDKLVITEHGYPFPENLQGSKLRFYENEREKLIKLHEDGAKIITISKYSAQKMKEDLGIRVYKYIYHGLLDDFRINTPRSLNNKTPSILWVSRLVEEKNPFTFLKAINILKNKIEFKAYLVGNGPLKQKIERYILKYDLKNMVFFINSVPFREMPSIYSSGSLFVHTNPREPFGLSILEAMGMGLPVIVPNSGGAQEIANGAGITFEANNHEDLADKILMILSDSNLYYKYSQKSIERAKIFSWKRAAKEYLEVYKKVGG